VQVSTVFYFAQTRGYRSFCGFLALGARIEASEKETIVFGGAIIFLLPCIRDYSEGSVDSILYTFNEFFTLLRLFCARAEIFKWDTVVVGIVNVLSIYIDT
jgi:hypothetical protein